MNILVTGAKGFVGKNLCAALGNIRDGKDRTRPALAVDAVFAYDIDTDPALLKDYCAGADFVFNLAGVNRPKDASEFMQGNFGFASVLLETLERMAATRAYDLGLYIQPANINKELIYMFREGSKDFASNFASHADAAKTALTQTDAAFSLAAESWTK